MDRKKMVSQSQPTILRQCAGLLFCPPPFPPARGAQQSRKSLARAKVVLKSSHSKRWRDCGAAANYAQGRECGAVTGAWAWMSVFLEPLASGKSWQKLIVVPGHSR